MTLCELSRTLPNGFHDAELNGIRIDFLADTIVLDMSLDVSSDDDSPDGKSEYKRARISLTGVRGFALPTPDDEAQTFSSPLDVSGDPVTNFQDLPELMRSVHNREILYSFYIDDWNSSLYVAAEEAELSWAEDEPHRVL